MQNGEVILEVSHLSKKFADSEPLKDVNCKIHQGEIISIIGPSGTGKSTFLRCINRLEQPTGGKIYFHGEEITDDTSNVRRMRQKIGMVFQSFNLFSNLNVLENITLAPMLLKKTEKSAAVAKAMHLLETVGLSEKAESYPDELSGGQKQRIAIVRSLAMEPELVLFDEPTSALDPRMVDEVLSVIKRLTEKNYAMMIVTHEMRFAEKISDRIFFMNDGIIYEEGSPQDILEHPQKEATKIFVNRLKIYEKTFTNDLFDFSSIQDEITDFSHKQSIDHRKNLILQLIFEEVVSPLLSRPENDTLPLTMKILYNEQKDECEVTVLYNGEKYDPLKKNDGISAAILHGIVQNIDYQYDGRNILRLKV